MGLTVDFFHDVVCGWCFNISPRLRVLAAEFDIEVRHRTFVLQESPEQMIAVFGSMAQAKETILGHWAACRTASDTPELFNIERMRAAPFDYPYGLPAALFCKAAERLSGQGSHWDMFDTIQKAHITEARNVADMDVMLEIAGDLGFDRDRFRRAVFDPGTRNAVDADRHLARRMQVTSVPTVIVRETGTRLVNGPIGDLRAQLGAALRLSA